MEATRLRAQSVVVVGMVLLLVVPLPGFGDAADGFESEFDQCPRPEFDIGLVLDRSGSMAGANFQAAQDGAVGLVEAMTGQDQTGLVSYNHLATLDKSLSFDHAGTISAIESLSAGGATATGDAIDISHGDMVDNRRPGVRDIMIVLTDGFTNSGSDPVTQASQAKADGIEIFAIGLGGNINEPELREIASEPVGEHFFNPADAEELLEVFEEIVLSLLPSPDHRASSVGVHAQTSVPVNPDVRILPNAAHEGTQVENGTMAHVDLPPPIDGSITALRGQASTEEADGFRYAQANHTIENATLLDGRIKARALHAVAESTTVSGQSHANADGSSFVDLEIDGEPIPTPVPPNTMIPLPGVGTVILHEVTTSGQADQASEILVNMIHVVADTAVLRGDIVVGQAYAGSSCDPDLRDVRETQDNDAGTGEDVGDAPSSAHAVDNPSVFQGRLMEGDPADVYKIQAEPGEKVQAWMVPSTRAQAKVHPLDQDPEIEPGLPNFDLYLLEPETADTREQSTLPASAPDRVELNVDKAGEWFIEVRQALGHGNYTLAIAVTPIALNPQNDALAAGDAPTPCPAARDIGNGLHPGVLRGDDFSDVYRVNADIGDVLAATLKPTEDYDGADFDLYLYDQNCQLLQVSELGKGAVPKGTPDAVTLTPVPISQDYYLEVRRHNGIGNYYLTVAIQDPQPTVGPLDAEPSGDAPSGPGSAPVIESPFVGQGSFPDGDTVDWYAFEATEDQRIVTTLVPSATSDLDLRLVRPDLTTAATSAQSLPAPEAIEFQADATGTWYLEVTRNTGGGDYLLSLATAP